MKNYYKLAYNFALKYKGKIQIIPKVPIKDLQDFAIWYTPGVAELSKRVSLNKDLSFELTWRWNTIAVVSDGTRVLGLGNIGPEAALPVMEGKALLFKYLGGVDAIPICIKCEAVNDFINFVKMIEPSFGGINLEDIKSPNCFYILEKLRKELHIPVWHDDQQGTATVVLAGLINSLKIVGKRINDIKVVFFGLGAANIAIINVLKNVGLDLSRCIAIDSKGVLHRERKDINELKIKNPYKYKVLLETNEENVKDIKNAFKSADVLIAASRPGPGVIKKNWIKLMSKDAIVFTLANPVPEIWPWEAKEAGARIVATGRSDLPNQVNNSLAFPSIFRGALDVRSKSITDEMLIAAAQELAKYVEEKGLQEDYIIPKMTDWEVYPRVAATVAQKACELGVSRIKTTWKEEYKRAYEIIENCRKILQLLMQNKIIV